MKTIGHAITLLYIYAIHREEIEGLNTAETREKRVKTFLAFFKSTANNDSKVVGKFKRQRCARFAS